MFNQTAKIVQRSTEILLLSLAINLAFTDCNPIRADIVVVTDVTTNMGEFSGVYALENMVNGAGLTGALHTNVGANSHWASSTGTTTGIVTFTLDGLQTVDFIDIWNYNEDTFTDFGVRNFEILRSMNGADFSSVMTVADLPIAPGTNNSTAHRIDPTDFMATHVRFDITANWGANGTGLSEVQFNSASAVPEPTSSLLLGMACCWLAYSRRRRMA